MFKCNATSNALPIETYLILARYVNMLSTIITSISVVGMVGKRRFFFNKKNAMPGTDMLGKQGDQIDAFHHVSPA